MPASGEGHRLLMEEDAVLLCALNSVFFLCHLPSTDLRRRRINPKGL